MRLLRSGLSRKDFSDVSRVVERLYSNIPSGVGRGRKHLRLARKELRGILTKGAAWAVSQGLGCDADLEVLEEGGCLAGAEPDQVSDRAYQRGSDQLGTLGSGNHFTEVQYVDRIYDQEAASAFGLEPDQITIMIHSGSRGLGHQVCSDYLKVMLGAAAKYGIDLPDRQLSCAPIVSSEGRRYLGAMAAAANYAFANWQAMTHWVRQSFGEALSADAETLGIDVVYDVCHNTAKFERFQVGGEERLVCVHRKGATRAYPPGHPDIPGPYRHVGQPVLIPGDMGRYSFVLAGTDKAFAETFGSSCHGAGRRMSRRKAKEMARGRRLVEELAERGLVIRAAGYGTVAEEMPEAYKDVADVVDVVAEAGISRKVARLRPIGVIKG